MSLTCSCHDHPPGVNKYPNKTNNEFMTTPGISNTSWNLPYTYCIHLLVFYRATAPHPRDSPGSIRFTS